MIALPGYEFAAAHYAAFLRTVGTAVTDGRIRYREDITDGLECASRLHLHAGRSQFRQSTGARHAVSVRSSSSVAGHADGAS
jgi:hypothetical protein